MVQVWIESGLDRPFQGGRDLFQQFPGNHVQASRWDILVSDVKARDSGFADRARNTFNKDMDIPLTVANEVVETTEGTPSPCTTFCGVKR